MVIVSGKVTVPKSAPGVLARLVVSVPGMTTAGVVVVTLAERDSHTDTRGQLEFHALAGVDEFVIESEEPELKEDTDVYWIADTDGTGAGAAETDPVVGAVNGIVMADGAGVISAAVAGTDYLEPVTTADGTYAVYNDGVTSGQVTEFTVTNGLITAVSVLP